MAPLANVTGDWHMVLWVGVAANVIVALLAILVLRPVRKAHRLSNSWACFSSI